MILILLVAVVAAFGGYALAYPRAHKAGHREGFHAGGKAMIEHMDEVRQWNDQPITVEFYEQHAALTVTSELYGTPDWFHHLCFKYAGENGEFHEHVGKASRDDKWSIFEGVKKFTPERRMALLKELGDELWYIVMLAKELGSSLGEVMLINITKRADRVKRGTIHGAGDNR